MLLIPYFTEATISPTTPGKMLALVHPGGSQVGSLFFRGFDLIGPHGGPVRLRLSRHPSKATGGTSSSAYSFLDGAPASFAQTLWGSVSWPSDTPTFVAAAFAETRAAGGGIVVPTQNASAGALTVGPNHTLVVETLDPDTRGDQILRLFWGEQVAALPHITSTVLAVDGTYTATTYFRVPPGWTAATVYLTYTAPVGSTGGKPRWRASITDGTSDFPLPLVNEEIDAIVGLEGRRSIQRMGDAWGGLVAAGDTVRIPISFELPPGAFGVRLDVTEAGDQTNRGTISATITGA